MAPTIILWVYIVMLLAGGFVGFIKAGSKISLFTSAGFAALLSLCALGILRPAYIADIVIAFLLIFFGMRFAKGKKFMPGGLMVVLSILALVLRFFLSPK